MWSVKCKVWSVKCGVWSVRVARCGVWSAAGGGGLVALVMLLGCRCCCAGDFLRAGDFFCANPLCASFVVNSSNGKQFVPT